MARSLTLTGVDTGATDAEITIGRIRLFLRADQVIAVCCMIGGAVIGVVSVRSWAAAVVVGIFAVHIAVQQWCVHRLAATTVARTSLIATGSVWALCLALAPLLSFALPVLLLPILITIVALAPVLDEATMPRFVLAGAAVITLTALGAVVVEGPIDRELAGGLADAIVVVGVAAFTVPLAVLAWDNHVRQIVAVGRLTDANDALRQSRQRLVTVADDERRTLERNLHDGAQQRLVAVSMRLGLLGATRPEVGDDAAELADEVQEAIDELRALAHGLSPPLLESRGLGPALTAVARRSGAAGEVAVDDVGRHDRAVETALYYCASEALQNAVKHGGPDVGVELTLRVLGDDIVVTVADRGPGFEVGEEVASGQGMVNMADRVAAVGGELSVTSSPGTGTVVEARVPTALR